jgi:hypothetical protein
LDGRRKAAKEREITMKGKNAIMNIIRMLVIVGFVLIQVGDANAQFGNLGNLINKKLNNLNTPTNQPPNTNPNTTSNNQPPADQSNNPQNPPASSVKASTSSLPALYQAIEQCDGVQFGELLKKDISSVNKKVEIRKVYPDGQWENIPTTPLEYASQYGCTNIISQLLDYEVEVTSYATVLAAANGRLEAIKMLLKAKAYPMDGVKAAVENGHADVLKALIEGGAHISVEDIETEVVDLRVPVKKGNIGMVQVVLKELAKGDPQKSYHKIEKFTLGFHEAERQGKLDIVKIFVADGVKVERTDIQEAIAANQSDMVAYLRETKKAQEAAAADQAAAAEKVKADQDAASNAELDKKIKDSLDHPDDAYGLADSRYRKFNGKIYDCGEPITFLNRLNTFNAIYDQYHNTKAELLIDAAKSSQTNPWLKVANDCSLLAVLVKQVTPDGLIVRLNSPSDQEVLVLLKNHPKQDKYVDGDVMIARLFAIKTKPYHYTGVLGVAQTIPAYDFGVVVPPPSGSVEKIPLPEADH